VLPKVLSHFRQHLNEFDNQNTVVNLASLKEALVVCSDNNLTTGITIWDISTGEELSHRPTCASPPHGLVCLGHQFLVAAQVQKPGSYRGGAIFIWALNKAQVLHRSYPVEPIGPLACTSDGAYLVGGAPSGKLFIWEVASGRLLQQWSSHHKSVSCLVFSDDDSLLISGADDGVIHVWPLISMLDTAEDSQGNAGPTCLYSWAEHGNSITDLVLSTGGSSSVVISSSLDCTSKVWSLGHGTLLQTFAFSTQINAIILDPGEQVLFTGSTDGTIFVSQFEIGLQDTTAVVTEDQSSRLTGHRGSITALAFSMNGLWLISASEDCTARVWDIVTGQVIRTFDHRKGKITNILVISQTFFPAKDCQKTNNKGSFPRVPVSSLEKSSQPISSFEGTVAILPSYCSLEEELAPSGSHSAASMKQQILDLAQERSPEAVQMKVETSVENRMWATSMIKHLIKVNKSLRSKFLDMVQSRLYPKSDDVKAKKRRRLDVENA
jgi:pre-rRNA-processing protein IPI3